MTLRNVINPILLKISKIRIKTQIELRTKEKNNINEAVIYAVNHSNSCDMPVVCRAVQKHCYILVGRQRLYIADRLFFVLYGTLWVDRKCKDDMKRVKKKIISFLKKGKSIIWFPEGTWNLTDNLLMLPMKWGIIDCAKQAGVSIVPIVLDYNEDNSKCIVMIDEKINPSSMNLKNGIDLLRDRMASVRYELWEERGIEHRESIIVEDERKKLLKAVEDYPPLNWLGLTSPVQDLHNQLDLTGSKIVFAVEMAYGLIVEAAKDTRVGKIVSIPIEYSMPTAIKAAAILKQKHPKLNATSVKWKEFLTHGEGNAFDPVLINNEEMAVIEYTGGTTGVPKGVMLSNKALNQHYVNFYDTNLNKIFSFEEKDRFISGVPIFLAFGLCAACHSPLCHSMELVLAPDPSPMACAKIVMKYKVNHVISGRLLMKELIVQAQKTNQNLSHVKTLMYGGEETNKNWEKHIIDSLTRFYLTAPLQNSYGMSETSAGVLTAINNETEGLIPCANVEVMIVSPENQNEYGYDTEGELCISTEQLMLGYFKNEKETVETIFEKDGVRWLRTHDLATISKDGFITITGRIKRIYSRTNSDMIQVRVYPMRIEEELSKSEYVERCAVIGIKDDIVAYRSIACIILKDKTIDSEIVKSELNRLSLENLPESHVPDEYIFVDSFPLTRAGKVDHRTRTLVSATFLMSIEKNNIDIIE